MGPPPYELGSEVIRSAENSPTHDSIDAVKKVFYVSKCEQDRVWCRRGKWLDKFPQHRMLSPEGQLVGNAWVESKEIGECLQDTVQICG